MYCVVQVNDVFNNPTELGGERWIAFPTPQVIFQCYDGHTGDFQYTESISLTDSTPVIKRKWWPRQQENTDTK